MDSRTERWDGRLLAGLSALLSVMALAWNFRHNLILVPPDATLHINIARRIFDSPTPGFSQLGTVWLPLPHLLQVPFVINDWLWRTGVGGSIPSMIAYVLGVLGMFRLMSPLASRPMAWMAALIYALNPNLLHMQATPMGESIYLAVFIWAVACFDQFRREVSAGQAGGKALLRCALMLAASMMVRYDGWFLAACVFAGVLLVWWRAGQGRRAIGPAVPLSTRISAACDEFSPATQTPESSVSSVPSVSCFWSRPYRAVFLFVAIIGATALLWLAYNYVVYHNAFEFLNGRYSAKNLAKALLADYPGRDDPRTAAIFFLKAATLSGGAVWGRISLLNAAFVALIAAIYFSRRHLALLLLWIPFVFYVITIAWTGVTILLPMWPPYGHYNVRYGLELLPAIAVFVALAGEYMNFLLPARTSLVLVAALAAGSYAVMLREGPICLAESRVVGLPHEAMDENVARVLRSLPPSATLMMDGTRVPGAVQRAGIHFRRVVHQGYYGAWQRGLEQPAGAADYLIAVAGDEVDEAVRRHPQGLSLIATVDTPGMPTVFIYRAMR